MIKIYIFLCLYRNGTAFSNFIPNRQKTPYRYVSKYKRHVIFTLYRNALYRNVVHASETNENRYKNSDLIFIYGYYSSQITNELKRIGSLLNNWYAGPPLKVNTFFSEMFRFEKIGFQRLFFIVLFLKRRYVTLISWKEVGPVRGKDI